MLEKANQVKNNLYEADMAFRNQTGEINVNKEEYQVAFGKLKDAIKDNKDIRETLNGTSKQNENDIDNTELKNNIEKIKEEIEKRKENIAKYYDALKDIKNVENLVKAGRTPDELKEDIENINNKIDTITDDNLKEELRGELNKALNPEKEQEGPEVPKDKKNDKKKWQKWITGGIGVVLGAGAVMLTPIGLTGALLITTGTQIAKNAANRYHERLKSENEITNIEKTGKLSKFKEKWRKWFRDETHIKNLNWFLNGVTIGAMTSGLLEQISGINYGDWRVPEENIITNKGINTGGNTPVAETTPNIKVGDSTAGMDLTTGYDKPSWAINGTNPEALNQGIMNDGNSVIRRIMDSQGNTYMSTEEALNAGKSLNELTFDIAKGMDMNNALSRTWANVETATRTLR